MKTIELSAFAGVRNDVSPERFKKEDLTKAINIELDETGKPYRRLGTTALDAIPTHSLWANDEMALCVRGGTLQRLLPDLSFHDYGVAIAGSRVAYRRVGNDVFFSDSLTTGIISSVDGYRPWGIVPPPAPQVELGIGSLRPGRYLITMTYVRSTGLESGACSVQAEVVGANQGLIFPALPVSADPLVTEKRIYVSDVDGELPYLVATLTNSETTAQVFTMPAERTLAVRTLQMGPPPAAQLIGYYKGCMYVAENNYLWYTQPYEFELVHRAMNYIGFTSPVKTFAPVSDGIYVGSDDETVFLKGDTPDKFERMPVANYGTVLGTEIEVPGYYFGEKDHPATPVQMWVSTHGLCVGLDGGQFMNLTGGRYVLPEGVAKGASLLKVRGASPQLVTTLFS